MALRSGLIVSLLVGFALSSSACSLSYNVAFSIEGDVTTNSQVITISDSCAKVVDPALPVNMSGMVSDIIHADLAQRVAKAENLAFSDQELLQPIQDGNLGPVVKDMLGDPYCAQLAVGLTLEAMLIDQIGLTEYHEAASQFEVVVNPRFGTWNETDLSVDGSGSLSKADG